VAQVVEQPASQVQNPEFKPQCCQKKKEKKKSRPTCSTQQVPGQPELLSETISKRQNKQSK
jgi:hypothetical protein